MFQWKFNQWTLPLSPDLFSHLQVDIFLLGHSWPEHLSLISQSSTSQFCHTVSSPDHHTSCWPHSAAYWIKWTIIHRCHLTGPKSSIVTDQIGRQLQLFTCSIYNLLSLSRDAIVCKWPVDSSVLRDNSLCREVISLCRAPFCLSRDISYRPSMHIAI